jgi:DNA-binding transcriptional regulator GbsR (MarR family)
MTTDPAIKLSPVAKRFILHWGEMGPKWGINRTVAQVHALLYLAPRALNAEEIGETLSIARSNVSTSLKELQGWGILRTVPKLGDRRDYFESMTDVWEMFRVIVDERKKRETDPTIDVLRQCVAETVENKKSDPVERERLGSMLEFFETMTLAYAQTQRLPTKALIKVMRMGDKLWKLIGAEK